MIPTIGTAFGPIPTFPVCVVLGILLMLLLTSITLRREENYIIEENYIFPKLVISGLIGFVCSGLLDSLFKIPVYGKFKITGITFYGGFIGGAVSLFLLLKATPSKTGYSVREWFELLTHPFILFHTLGRIGCFFGGCCYGKVTDSILGFAFCDNPSNNIFHNGAKRYPTQLFEATALILIFLLLLRKKNKFSNYVMLYATARFIIEFFRDDERGYISAILSPAQLISVLLLTIAISCKAITAWKQYSKSNRST